MDFLLEIIPLTFHKICSWDRFIYKSSLTRCRYALHVWTFWNMYICLFNTYRVGIGLVEAWYVVRNEGSLPC